MKRTEKQIAIDTHFHANIKGRSRKFRQKNADMLVDGLKHLDILCSTEHAYKDPLEAYDYLSDVAESKALPLEVVPGVEAISKEGIDIIFLFRSKAGLEDFLSEVSPFSWSIKDVASLGHKDSVTILPHAFSPSKTGIVTSLGFEQAQPYFDVFDYIEVSNGGFFDADFLPSRLLERMEKVKHTRQFPAHFHPESVGISVGSDAHTPKALNIYGKFNGDSSLPAFDHLGQRRNMSLNVFDSKRRQKAARIAGGLTISIGEYFDKRPYKRRR